MEVPILKQGPYLIASVQSALSDNDLTELRDSLVTQAGQFRSWRAIVDVTALGVMLDRVTRLRGKESRSRGQ